MCDGITQGRAGMELSLFSRDVIAMSTAIALSHDMFDAALMLGVCDKIVPGLLIGALSFGHLPTVFVPAGPDGLRAAERREERRSASCTPTARSAARSCSTPRPRPTTRPGHLHVLRHRELQPDADGGDGPAPARRQLRQPGHAAARGADRGRRPRAAVDRLGETPRSATSSTRRRSSTACVALLATGGSTNHTMHLVAIAAGRGHRRSPGTTSPTCRPSCRCWPGSTPTARPTSTTSTPPAAPRSWSRALLERGPPARRRAHRRRARADALHDASRARRRSS